VVGLGVVGLGVSPSFAWGLDHVGEILCLVHSP
jgi:hypothetical protein